METVVPPLSVVDNKKTRCLACFFITACRGAKSDRESVHLRGSIPIFPLANPSITIRDNSITPLPSSVYMSTLPPLLVFAFDIV